MPDLVLTPSALVDLQEAEHWYEAQRFGLGTRFRECVDAKFSEIQQTPHWFALQAENTRIAVLKPFPYLIVFEAIPDQVTILAVYHAHRDPRLWKPRS